MSAYTHSSAPRGRGGEMGWICVLQVISAAAPVCLCPHIQTCGAITDRVLGGAQVHRGQGGFNGDHMPVLESPARPVCGLWPAWGSAAPWTLCPMVTAPAQWEDDRL
uniref:Uncharacterized protein n=1 Tax=Knipowitschia caucasica TaxID=637954 RepID=A0AAV2K0I9_KNICA